MGQWIKLFTFFLSIVIVIIATAIFNLTSKMTCYESSCLRKGCEIKSVMNDNSVPCKNFKNFSCGKSGISLSPIFDQFDQNLKLFQDHIFNTSSEDYGNNFLNKVRTVYDKCCEKEQIRDTDLIFKTFLYRTGPFPNMFDQSYFKNIDLPIEDYEFNSRRIGLTAQSLFSVYLHQNHKHPDNTSIYIGLPSSTFIDPRSILKVLHNTTLMDDYQLLILDTLNYYILVNPSVKEKLNETIVSHIADLELKLGTILEDQKNQRRTILSTNVVKLSKRFLYFNWNYYFKKMYPKVNLLKKKIVVTSKKYLYEIEELFKNKYILALYMIYRNILEVRPFIFPGLILQGKTTTYENLGALSFIDRNQFCKDLTYRYFGPGLTSLIIERFSIKHGGQNIIKDIIQNIKESFNESIYKSSWMDSRMKQNVLKKLSKIKDVVSISDTQLKTLSNTFARQKYYLGFCVHRPIFYIIIDLNLYMNKKNNELFDRKQSAFEESVGLHFHGILYNQNENELIVPVGVLQPPVFDFYWPPYLYYGGIGSEISRVLIQGFHRMIRQYSEENQANIWWSNYTKDKYDRKYAQCLDYSGLFAVNAQGNSYINDVLEQTEGMTLAFRAYKRSKSKYFFDDPQLDEFEQYTSEEMFFISYGNCFCLSRPQFSPISSTTEPFKTSLDIIDKNKYFKDAFSCKKSSYDSKFLKTCMFW